ncbi:hypothetical protein [Flavicella sp.]|uniref:hypothetical protein n=1 Tax=Flavicella sp. TaxID=2957742 RepID=UPI00301B5BAD
MKKIINQIVLYFKSWRRKRTLNDINKNLKQAVKNKQNKRLLLRYEITKLIHKYAKLDKDNKSKFIPLDLATIAEIKFQVDLQFGSEMKRHNVVLNNKLQVI